MGGACLAAHTVKIICVFFENVLSGETTTVAALRAQGLRAKTWPIRGKQATLSGRGIYGMLFVPRYGGHKGESERREGGAGEGRRETHTHTGKESDTYDR